MPGRPHILLITMDELRKDALGCYGGKAVPTPHLDALASQSIQFDRAYTVSPLCLPARCALLTGLRPHRSGAYSNFRPSPLRPEDPNLYNLLRGADYCTAHIGKCHYVPVPYSETVPEATLDGHDNREFYLRMGLDHLDLQEGKFGTVWFQDDYSRELEKAGLLAAYREACWDSNNGRVFPFPGPAEWHPDSWVGRKACEWLEQCDPAQPQFLWVSFEGPHYPFDPPAEYLDRVNPEISGVGVYQEGEWDDPSKIQAAPYQNADGQGAEGARQAPNGAKNCGEDYWRKLRQHYFANVAQIDDWIGRVLQVAERRLGPNIVVAFTSDHGEMLGNHHLWGKNGCAYEDVMSIPMLLRVPGMMPTKSDAKVQLFDLMPTFLTAAEVALPEKLDARDLNELIQKGGRDVVIAESELFLVASDGRYKYAQMRRGDVLLREFHDLEEDPLEFRNFADDPRYAQERERLQTHLLRMLVDQCLS